MFKNIFKFSFIILAIFIADFLALYLMNFFENSTVSDALNFPGSLAFKSARVLGETDQNQEAETGFSSEDFRIEHLALGGGLADQIITLEDGAPLKIYDVASEVLSVKDDPKKTYLAVTWKTNKATQNEITYSKKGESVPKTIQEDDFSIIHTLILPDLDADSVYEYLLLSRDRLGNEKTSDQYMAYSGAPTASLIDVLQGAAEKVFGWAIKK